MGVQGFEPRSVAPKATMLPLHQTPGTITGNSQLVSVYLKHSICSFLWTDGISVQNVILDKREEGRHFSEFMNSWITSSSIMSGSLTFETPIGTPFL